MIRSIAWLALLECSVPRQRCPVSANVIAASMVSVSRISPIKNHVRRLAQGIFQRCLKRMRVESDFALRDDGFLVPVDEFDRIFDGDDMAGFVRCCDDRSLRPTKSICPSP